MEAIPRLSAYVVPSSVSPVIDVSICRVLVAHSTRCQSWYTNYSKMMQSESGPPGLSLLMQRSTASLVLHMAGNVSVIILPHQCRQDDQLISPE